MNSVGRILRSARERQGRELAEIADELCLTQQYVRAIEADDVKSLPGAFFYKNFVRQYAAIVGVKDAELRSGVDSLTAAFEEPVLPGALAQPPVRPMDPIVADNNRSYFASTRMGLSVAGLAVALVACSAFYAWWSRPAEAAMAKVSTPPPVMQPSVQPAVQAVGQPVAQPVVETVAQQNPSEPTPVQLASQVIAETQTQVAADGTNHVVLNLSATEKTWLSISSEGKRLFSGFLEPSQTKTLTGIEAARMTVGNAGGLEVRLNGRLIGPIGKSGQVRTIVFTPDNFQVLPAEPPPPASETL
ncbi:MAG TPA: RodZ domain-containing protein [Bryobacteraceae bacterium]